MPQLTNENVEMILGRILLAEEIACVAIAKLCKHVAEQADDASVGDALLSDIKQMIANGIDARPLQTDLSVENIRRVAHEGLESDLANDSPGKEAEVRKRGVLSEADIRKIEEDAYSDDDDLDTDEA